MNGLSILMFIFSLCLYLTGLYMYKGHKIEYLEWRVPYKNLTKAEWKNIGKWTMITSTIPLIIGIIGLFLDI